jgi:hypothetical protein
MDLYIHSPIHLHAVVLNYLSTGETFLLLLVGSLGWEIGPSQSLYLHRKKQIERKNSYTHAPSMFRTHDPSASEVEDVLSHADQRAS